jgi:uroporphyrinogen decarboxylase
MNSPTQDGIHALLPRDKMTPEARQLRDTYAITPGIPLVKREFGYYCLDEWKAQGMPQNVPFEDLFDYDKPARYSLGQLGWCEAAFAPAWEDKVLETRGDYDLVQDYAGRHVLFFRGRRDGFMPEYVDHPVKDMKTWQENVKWRLDPTTASRFADEDKRMAEAVEAAGKGWIICQNFIGGYMYLRSLIGPANLLYAFYDMPDVIHDCMQTWLALNDALITRHQQHVSIDEVYIGEDICYNAGSLISPDMIREFLFPYYQQVLSNIRARQIDKQRHVYFQLDTDGYAPAVIPVYRELGMDITSPLEVASGCDVVKLGQQYPDMAFFGAIDKRVLALGRKAIDAHLEHIIPTMRARGGYIPTSDHGVPAEVPYQDYLYYRKRVVELGSQ